MTPTQKKFLEKPVDDLPLSDELKNLLAKRGYKLLKDVLAKKIYLLRKKDGLTIHHELELFNIVEENGLEKWWKED